MVGGRRRLIRFEKQLQESFKDMPQFIVELMYGVIVGGVEIQTTESQKYIE